MAQNGVAATPLHISDASGDDEKGDGSQTKPFRTLLKVCCLFVF